MTNFQKGQERKDFAIAFYNANNLAVQLITSMGSDLKNAPVEEIQEAIATWRDWFLQQHGEYRENVIDKIEDMHDEQEVLQAIENCKTDKELRKLWLSLPQEARNSDVIKLAAKAKHENL